MEVQRLRKDELIFEVGTRGFVPTDNTITVDELRLKLRDFRQRESAGESFENALNLQVDDELTTVDLKIQEVDLGLSDIQSGGETSPNRIRTLLSHLNHRLSLLLSSSRGLEREKVKQTCEELKTRVTAFRALGSSATYAASSVGPYSAIRPAQGSNVARSTPSGAIEGQSNQNNGSRHDGGGSHSSSSSNHSVREAESSGDESIREAPAIPNTRVADDGNVPVGPAGRNTSGRSEPRNRNVGLGASESKRVDFHKWHLMFTGDDNKSINSFLIDVEEKAETYGVTEARLLMGISELLDGSAKLWYRMVKSDISSWSEFKRLIKQEYLPLDYTDTLWEEIRGRKQGEGELMGAFVSIMMGLFDRLDVRVSDEMKLDQIMKNLHPFYTERLAMTKVLSIRQLKELGKQLEVSKFRIEKYQMGSTASRSKQKPLEPEFAFKGSSRRPGVNALDNAAGEMPSRGNCWNCGKPGHRHSVCRSPVKNKFCWVCGKKDVTKFKCPDCVAAGRVIVNKGEENRDQERGN